MGCVIDEVLEEMAEERAVIMAEERAAIMAEKMAEEAGVKITLTATAECVFNLLEEYGPIPSELRNMVLAQKELQTLKNWQKLAARVRSVEEFAQQAGLQTQQG